MLSQQEDLQVRPGAWWSCMAAACSCVFGMHQFQAFMALQWMVRRPFVCKQTHLLVLLQALGSVFQELIFSALSTAGPSEITSGAALQRLLTDVFQGRINEFK